jgi:type II secretory pathway pseudopilin PulG
METETGVNLERDLDRLVVAAGDFDAKEPKVAVMVWGRLDAARITKAIEAAADTPAEKVERRTAHGRTLLMMQRGGKPDNALVLLADGVLLFGSPNVVETTLANHAGGSRPLQGNLPLAGLLRQIEPASSIWIAVGQTATAAMRKSAGPQPPPFPIPEAMSLAGSFGGAFELAAEMPDAAAATQMLDVVRGGLALLQGQLLQDPKSPPSPDLKRTFDSIQLQATGKRARLFLPGPNGGAAAAGMIAAIAVPSLLRARTSANDSMAIGDIRTVISAEAAYQTEAQGYGNLACLAKPSSCLKGYKGPSFLDEELASGRDKGGFKRAFHPGPPGKKPGTLESFAYTTTPLEAGKSGIRSFCGDSTGRICFDAKGAAILPLRGACPQSCTTLQ